jgi:predicted phosphate transport protein (TIGR00153 family)
MGLLNFLPREEQYFDLFIQMTLYISAAARELKEMLADKNHDYAEYAQRIKGLEHACDELTHNVSTRLNKSFITPFDREDIYALSSSLDDVMDYMEEAVDLVNLYEVERLPKELANQVEVIQRCAELTAEAMPRLQAMKNLEEYWIEINRLENAGDKSYRRILAKLFSGKYDALEVLKLKDIVDSLEKAIDAFEKVANIVEQIHVKES